MVKEIKIGEMYLKDYPDNTKVIDLGDPFEISKSEERAKEAQPRIYFITILISLVLSIIPILGFIASDSFALLLPVVLIFAFTFGIATLWLKVLKPMQLKAKNTKLQFAKSYNGSYYRVGSKEFFYGKKGEYHILSQEPYYIGVVNSRMGDNDTDNVYMNNIIITKHSHYNQNIGGNYVKVQTEKTKIELFGKKGIFHIGKVDNEKDVLLGNDRFDNKFLVVSNNSEWAKKILDKETQKKIADFIWKMRITHLKPSLFGKSKSYDFVMGIAEEGGVEFLLPSTRRMCINDLKILIDILYPITEKFKEETY